jgi:hypothetical protein
MGSGSGLFGVGDPPTDPASTTEGPCALSEAGQDQAPRHPARYIFGEGNTQRGQVSQPVRQDWAANGVAQRFPVPRAPVKDEAGESRSKVEIVLGVVGIVFVLLSIRFLFSMFQD